MAERDLIRKRGIIKHKSTAFVRFVNKLKNTEINDTIIAQLQTKVSSADSYLIEFDEVNLQIIELCEEPEIDKHLAERDAFEESYVEAISYAHTLLRVKVEEVIDDTDSNRSQRYLTNPFEAQTQTIKLPTIQLPKFSGSFENWLEFKDSYESLIHNNNAINSVQKFHYLRAALTGTAIQVIHSLEFSAANYELAWQLLQDRYNNSRLLIHNHVKAIFDASAITGEFANQLRQLIDTSSKHLRALNILGEPTQHWDTLIVFMLVNKLDVNTMREWEEVSNNERPATFEELKQFLMRRADFLETIEAKHLKNKVKGRHSSYVASEVQCNNCSKNHLIYSCADFLQLNISERAKRAKALKLCYNCLRTGHTVDKCRLKSCIKCNKKHNSLLHTDSVRMEEPKPQNLEVALSSQVTSPQILLSTAVITVKDFQGNYIQCRALLDSGSQSNFISAKLCEQVKPKLEKIDVTIMGIGQVSTKIKNKCKIFINSLTSNFKTNLSCLVIPNISESLPSHPIDISSLPLPANIQLADPNFDSPQPIDLLIGASLFWELFIHGKISLGKNQPCLHNSKLGWVIAGSFTDTSAQTFCAFSIKDDLHNQVEQFWEIENCDGAHSTRADEDEKECEKQFMESVTRNESNRFIVKLPLKGSLNSLGDSSITSLRRFLHLEQKLSHKPEYSAYVKFMNEYEQLGHMSKLDSNTSGASYYLPHHGVVKVEGDKIKIRVVFDGSAPSSSGISLNDLQFVGPKIHGNIFSILIRFRQHKYVISSDISKMYRQILMHPDHRPLQKIYWRNNPEDSVSVYQLNTVTYGTKSAPFLAMRCIKELSKQNSVIFPMASNIIDRDFYVDDLLTGDDDLLELQKTCNDISFILSESGFEMHKWRSNCPQILENIKNSETQDATLVLGKTDTSKTLGIQWDSTRDILSFKITPFVGQKCISKRNILSEISRIYDPLGVLGPSTIIAKIIIQELWLLSLSWDDNIPTGLFQRWQKLREQLELFNELQFPRQITTEDHDSIDLHGFCDASKSAYAACVYASSKGSKHFRLVTAKTRVAPVKSLTIPRLELCGAVLLVNLMEAIKNSLTKTVSCYYWTDSQVVLCWIQSNPTQLMTFVANRIIQIQSLMIERTAACPAGSASGSTFVQRQSPASSTQLRK